MVLHKLILEKYLNNRFIAGVAEGREEGRVEGREKGREEGREKGREEADEEWRAWYNRMVEARERGDEFDEPPPESPRKKSSL